MSIIAISEKLQSGKNLTANIIQYLVDKKKMNYKTKDTKEDLESYLKNKHNLKCDWTIKQFGTKLKQIISILTNISIEELEEEEIKNKVLSSEWDRYLLKEYLANDNYIVDEKCVYFATEKNMQDYINKAGHTVYTCYQVGKRSITIRQLLQQIGTEVMRDAIHPNIWVNALFNDYYKSIKELNPFEDPIPYFEKNAKYPNWIITDLRFPNELKAVKEKKGITIKVNRDLQKESDDYSHISKTALDDAEFDYVINNNETIDDLIKSVREILKAELII